MPNDFLHPKVIAFVNRRSGEIVDRYMREKRRFYETRLQDRLARFKKHCEETITFRFAGKCGDLEQRICILDEEIRLREQDFEEQKRRWALPISERDRLYLEDLKEENQILKQETRLISRNLSEFWSPLLTFADEQNKLEAEDMKRFCDFLHTIKQTYLNRPQWEHGRQAYGYWLEKCRLARLAEAYAPHTVH